MSIPVRVGKNFSRSSRSYTAAGAFQRSAARHLYGLLERELANPDRVRKVLELGCGTGFLTIGLLRLFPDAQFVVSDISESMLTLCMDVTRPAAACHGTPAYFECYNIAEANIEKNYDLIISSLAFQWLPDLEAVLHNAREHLLPEGKLVFSTLLDGTFVMLHRVFAELGLPYPGPPMITESELRAQCAVFPRVRLATYTYVEEHASVLDFLRQIQRTGAGNGGLVRTSVADMRRVLARYRELAGDGPIEVEYFLAEVICDEDENHV
ncbi:MAG: methyltransferase [Victivallales bacterium]|nr:methyltransferase [Victivallales bacterium]